jgi:hypothetical protein
MLSSIAEIVRDLLIFIAVMTALLIAFVVIVSKMPETNPLKRVLSALSYRLGATIAAGAVAIPLEPIPGIDMLYNARRVPAAPHQPPGQAPVKPENPVPQERQVTAEKQVTHKDR